MVRYNRVFGIGTNTKRKYFAIAVGVCFLVLYSYFQTGRSEGKNGEKSKKFNNSPNNCEVIHIGLVCGGYNSTLLGTTLFKSLLFHRQNPIHFHIIVDEVAKKILSHLFQTWMLPQVQVTFYYDKKYQQLVQWIPNVHYSGVFGLLKILFPEIITQNVDRILVLDTDLTILTDIAKLWKEFRNFNNTQAIGVVENQSNWYISSILKPWPAIGKGFNSGVMLLDLKRLSSRGWRSLWRTLTAEYLITHGTTSLADQDIYNAVIKNISDIVYLLDCTWNVQLNHPEISRSCYNEIKDIKIIHWNSPFKLQTPGDDVINTLRVSNNFFLEYNGNYLRHSTFHCGYAAEPTSSKIRHEDGCEQLRKLQENTWRTHLFITDFQHESEQHDVTLVAQLSFDRIQMLDQISKNWEGPMSITFYATDQEVQKILQKIRESFSLKGRKNIAYHIVYKETDIYPINYLRNVGLRNVVTPFVFLSDIDFVPSLGIYNILKQHISRIVVTSESRIALVIPAFETQRYKFRLPKSKTELLGLLKTETLTTFRANEWPQGHEATNFLKWKNATKPYEVVWVPNFEPYIVVSSKVPEYDTRFVGFGWNKVSHLMTLHANNYKFVVLNDCFIIHLPHTPSYDLEIFRVSQTYRRCLRLFREEFTAELRYKFHNYELTKHTIGD